MATLREIVKRLAAAGLTFREGGNHTKVYKDGKLVSVIPRHREIAPNTVRAIEKQTGVKLT